MNKINFSLVLYLILFLSLKGYTQNYVWTEHSDFPRIMTAIASSADGSKLAVAEWGGYVFVSSDYGSNWLEKLSPGRRYWKSILISPDGSKLMACADSVFISSDGGLNWIPNDSIGDHNFTGISMSADGMKLAACDYLGNLFISKDGGKHWISIYLMVPQWNSITSSYDGNILYACSGGGFTGMGNIFKSIDGGSTWSGLNAGNRQWGKISTSFDGIKVAAVGDGHIYSSVDTGNTWTYQSTLSDNISDIIISSDGTFMATYNINYIYTTSDGGINWIKQVSTGNRHLSDITSSSDGSKLAASVSGGFVFYSSDYGSTWIEQKSNIGELWSAITSSSDGSKIAASINGGAIYTSTDEGYTWLEQNSGQSTWKSVTSSSDGMKLAACFSNIGNYGYIITSTDGGNNWTDHMSAVGLRYWTSITSSSDGTKLAACVSDNNGGYIYSSPDGGNTWTSESSTGSQQWTSITSSSDGNKLAACVAGGYIFISTDGGNTWLGLSSAGSRNWTQITSSSDGSILAACVDSGYIYTSIDEGYNWTEHSSPGNRRWSSITSSSDGMTLSACVDGGYIYISSDYGTSWSQLTPIGKHNWSGITISKDGNKIAACVNGGDIYTGDLYQSSFLTTGIIGESNFCQGASFSVPYSAMSGVFNSGNIFTAQLSDFTGSFSNPTDIGSVVSQSDGQISCTIPINTPTGTLYRIRVTGSNPANIGSDNGTDLTVNPLPNPSISGPGAASVGQTVNYYSNAPPGTVNLWGADGGTITGSNSNDTVSITWNLDGQEQVSLQQTILATGCQNTLYRYINVNPSGLNIVGGDIDSVICYGGSVQLGLGFMVKNGVPPYRYKWNPASGLSNDTVPHPMAMPDNTTIYTLKVTDSKDSTASTTDTVTVNPPPTPSISGNNTVTIGDTVQYTCVKPAGTTNQWSVVGGTILGIKVLANVKVIWDQVGTGKLILQQKISATGCQQYDTLLVTVGSLNKLVLNAGGDKSICPGDSVTLGSSNPAGGGKPPYNFKWTPSTGLSNDTIPNPVAKPDNTITYNLQVTDSRDSTANVNITVTVNPLPNPVITGNQNTNVNSSETYTTTADAGTTTLWSVNGNGTITKQDNLNATVLWSTIGTGVVKAEQTTQYGCKGTDSITVAINSVGECLSTQDITLDPVYIIPGYNVSRLGVVSFTNICDQTLNITKINYTNSSGNIRIKDTLPNKVNFINPQNDVEFTVEYKPTSVGTDLATIELVTDKGEHKTAKIAAQALQGDVNTPLTVLKLIPVPPEAAPGVPVTIQLKIVESRNVQLKASMKYSAQFSFNGEVLQYQNFDDIGGRVQMNALKPPQILNKEYDYTVQLDGFARTDSTVLGQIYTESLLGIFNETPIYFKSFKWMDTTIKAEVLNDGVFQLSLCNAGGQRLLEQGTPAGLQLLEPNPAGESANLIFSTLEEGRTKIYLVNELGITKKEIFDGTQKSGTYQVAFDTKDMDSGLYFIIMETPSDVFREKFIIFK